jgi:hypothetical protein
MTAATLAERREERLAEERRSLHRLVRWCIVIGGGAALLAALVLGSLVLKIAVTVVVLAMLQGLWRGGAELAGVVVGLALAVPIALPTGRALEGVTASIARTSGLTNRLLSILIVASVVTAAGGLAGRIVAKRMLASRPRLKLWDPYIGAALGLAEGCLLALMLLWAPLALEPIARAQMTEPDAGGEPRAPSFAAVGVAKAADEVRQSGLGRVAEATNPFGASDLLALAADFAAVSRDPDALDSFVNTPVMQRIHDLESVKTARQMLEADPKLAPMFSDGGISADTLGILMDSPTVLRVFDETTVVSDIRPLEKDLIDAIRKARTKIRTGSNGR